MAENKKVNEKPGIGRAVERELDQLRKKVKELTLRLQREVKARELNAGLAAKAKKAREQVGKEAKTLRDQGRKLALQLKSAITDANKRQQALEEAQSKITEMRAQLSSKTVELKRKSNDLRKLVAESGHRAAEIIRGKGQPVPEPEKPSTAPTIPSEPGPEESRSDKPTSN